MINKVMRYKGQKTTNLLPKDPAQFYTTTQGFVFFDEQGQMLKFYGKEYLDQKFAELTPSGAFRFCGQKQTVEQVWAIPNPKAGDTYQVQDQQWAYNSLTQTWVLLGYNMDLSGFALKEQLPKKTSDLTNDNGFVTETQTDAKYVQKESGKSLIDDDKILKINGIQQNAQKNVIESITINGNTPAVSNKNQNFTLLSCSPFPSSFVTNKTTKEFCDSIKNTPSAVVGMTYLGALFATDMPFPGNSQVIVRIMTSSKVMVLQMFSTTTACNHWYAMYSGGQMSTGDSQCPWRGIMSIPQTTRSSSPQYTPQNNYDAASKKYVDDSLQSKQNSTDNTLQTTDKTIAGAINELNSKINALNDILNQLLTSSSSNSSSTL